MTIIEGFTNIAISGKNNKEKKELMKILLFGLLIKLLVIYIIATFLWPYIMPKLFKNVTTNPKFLHILGFSIIIGLL
jgi:cytochrome bd-type quinol oxidase subunit 2